MSNLRELYQEVIIDHSKNPRNFGQCECATHHAEGFNPLCGDKISLSLEVENDLIKNACFTGSGCAISTASASLMTEVIKGKTIDETKQLFTNVHTMLTRDNFEDTSLGKLEILAGVREFPMRVKCATLAWHTLQEALPNDRITKQPNLTVSTE